MVRSRSRNSLSDPQQLGQSVRSEPPGDRWDVDAIEQWQIWIDIKSGSIGIIPLCILSLCVLCALCG